MTPNVTAVSGCRGSSCGLTMAASLLPMPLAKLGADTPLASGSIATVLQDLLSVAFYLGIATLILR
ncbi:MAG: hypothetical protein AB7P14_08340 [Blastocatellales bacterium]